MLRVPCLLCPSFPLLQADAPFFSPVKWMEPQLYLRAGAYRDRAFRKARGLSCTYSRKLSPSRHAATTFAFGLLNINRTSAIPKSGTSPRLSLPCPRMSPKHLNSFALGSPCLKPFKANKNQSQKKGATFPWFYGFFSLLLSLSLQLPSKQRGEASIRF